MKDLGTRLILRGGQFAVNAPDGQVGQSGMRKNWQGEIKLVNVGLVSSLRNVVLEKAEKLMLQQFNLFIAKRIKVARKKAGLTVKDLAEEAHLPLSYVANIEKGLCSPSHHAIEKIEKATGVNFNWENIYEEWKSNHA